MRLKLALVVVGLLAVFAVSGASAADFEKDSGSGADCTEPPGGGQLLRCPTAYVGQEYEVEMESEEGSGCTSPGGNPYVWYEIANSTLPAGLSMSRQGVISGVPTSAGFVRFWVWNHDLTQKEGGPEWCQREDRSEVEFSIFVDPGLAIATPSLNPATVGQPYDQTLVAQQVTTLSPPTGPDVEATWSLESGALPPGLTLSAAGVLSGTIGVEGNWGFVIRAQNGGPVASQAYTLSARQPMVVKSPLGPAVPPSSEVGIRLAKTFTATGGSGTYTWELASGALPPGVTLDPASGAIAGTPSVPGSFSFTLAAKDSEGRLANVRAALTVARRLAIRTTGLKAAQQGRAFQAKVATVGGVQPLSWKVVRGKLAPGVTLSKQGVLTGKPSRTGRFPVVLEARDALGAKSRKTLVLVVKA